MNPLLVKRFAALSPKLQTQPQPIDHRSIGALQQLFFFSESSPGSPFFLPHGTLIYNKLLSYLREEYMKRKYLEIKTPVMFHSNLWERSGHSAHYKDDMYHIQAGEDKEDNDYSLKPMNCPAHCLTYLHLQPHTYRSLPLRLADFGTLHRNELRNTLTGLTRVRSFVQDDAHIFCTKEQLASEMSQCLDFVKEVYQTFGFSFETFISTRPKSFIGTLDTWQNAELVLRQALEANDMLYAVKEGDGAFYGPKIDITIKDALNRKHQCATIQLDFQLPERFDLTYVPTDAEPGKIYRPVIIHRAILGSLERMIAILCEHYAGKWPFWLSPRQVIVIPVAPAYNAYAEKVQKRIYEAGILSESDLSGDTLNKKIRNAEISQFNFIVVVGKAEQQSESVNVRDRDSEVKGKSETVPLKEIIRKLVKLKDLRINYYDYNKL